MLWSVQRSAWEILQVKKVEWKMFHQLEKAKVLREELQWEEE